MPSDAKAPRSQTGVPGLDDILHGGLIPHRLYLLEGTPGAGKTTTALQYLLEGLKNGEKCLYVTLSESGEELRAGAASHGWSLEGVDIVELIATEDDLDGEDEVTMYHPAEVELGRTVRAVMEAVARLNPSRVIVDSLSELRLLAQSSLRYRRQVLAFKQFFSKRQATVILLDDMTADNADLQLHSIAHGVITLEQLAPIYGAARRRLRVVKFRGTSYRGGYHDFSIEPEGVVTYPRLIAAEHGAAFSREQVKSGVASLDNLLGGGPHYGTSTLLLGPAGSGKSTIAALYAYAAARRGDHAVVFSFEENKATLITRLHDLGIKIEDGDETGQIKLYQIDPAELSPGEFSHLVRRSVEQDHARVIVIDSLNGYMNAMPEEHFLTIQLHEVLSYLARRGVMTLMVMAQQGLIGNMAAPIDTSYLADSVVLFRYFEYAGQIKKAISVVKKRSGRHEETIRELHFDAEGIHLSEPLAQFRGVLTGMPLEISAPVNKAS